MKVVIICNHFFPRISPRSNRATELAKEFARRGHEVIVYALTGGYDYSDFSKQTGVTVKNYGKSKWGLMDSLENTSIGIVQKVIKKIFGKYLWLPDRELIKFVKRAIRLEQTIDLLITIARPHVLHYAVSLTNLKNVKKWIADCGDPFTLNPIRRYPGYFVKYEYAWCRKCDVIAVPFEGAINGYYPEFRHKIKVIPQGFSFKNIKLSTYKTHNNPTFAYVGAVYKVIRDPELFLQYLDSIDLDFTFYVYTSSNAWAFFSEHSKRAPKKIVHMDRVSREEMLLRLSEMDFVINISNSTDIQMPSKLIDYSLIKRPILNITSEFTAEQRKYLNEFFNGDYTHQYIVNNINDYNIINVVDKFLDC